jgi:GT2 family glycosyltransferase
MLFEQVGIVVIGRNEGARLLACLNSLKAAAQHIVYVDSGSTDGSVAAATETGASVIQLDPTTAFSAARARNEGFFALMSRQPNTRFVQFVDGDCILAPNWIDKACAFLEQNGEIAAVFGRRREIHPEASVYNALCDIEWNTPIGESRACGGDVLIRADALTSIGGYRSRLIAGEEPEMCVRLRQAGYKIWRLDQEMTQHDAAMLHFRQWWSRSVRAGHAYAEVSALTRSSPFGIWAKETRRALFWGGLLPLAIIVASLIYYPAVLAFLVYPAQIGRLSCRRGARTSGSWRSAVLITLAKFAEFQGIMTFMARRQRRLPPALIEYK